MVLAVKPLFILLDWYVAPLSKLYVTPLVGAVTVIIPVAVAQVGCVTVVVGVAGIVPSVTVTAVVAVLKHFKFAS